MEIYLPIAEQSMNVFVLLALGGAAGLLAAFRRGDGIGVPMLQFYGMTAEPHQAEALGLPRFPKMQRWLR